MTIVFESRGAGANGLNQLLFFKDMSHNPWCDGVGCYLIRQRAISSLPSYHFNSLTTCGCHLVVLPLMARPPGASYQQYNVRHDTTRISLNYLRALITSPWPARFQRHDGSSRPRATADRKDRLTVRLAATAPDSSLSTTRLAICTRVSTMTIHRWLIEQNLRSHRPLRSLSFIPVNCRTRLQWSLA
ncbi:HTH_Tnp_Tc3_2 domain-containing protein [Trichonephila clavipes]|uniref:HTH_Tnp_Tc3_2 domain-containing protein n=1 Tax=Trichonephila clavipes TaxID=2585209 RepID=A0A8X6T1J9_TRICX|nr:HTH_Tnp_Tc3_2 domain-containing protein [Trichonephila clavipes]